MSSYINKNAKPRFDFEMLTNIVPSLLQIWANIPFNSCNNSDQMFYPFFNVHQVTEMFL